MAGTDMAKRLTVDFDGNTLIDRDVHTIESQEHASGEYTLMAQFDPIPLTGDLTGKPTNLRKTRWP
jgi:hypothetical protein